MMNMAFLGGAGRHFFFGNGEIRLRKEAPSGAIGPPDFPCYRIAANFAHVRPIDFAFLQEQGSCLPTKGGSSEKSRFVCEAAAIVSVFLMRFTRVRVRAILPAKLQGDQNT